MATTPPPPRLTRPEVTVVAVEPELLSDQRHDLWDSIDNQSNHKDHIQEGPTVQLVAVGQGSNDRAHSIEYLKDCESDHAHTEAQGDMDPLQQQHLASVASLNSVISLKESDSRVKSELETHIETESKMSELWESQSIESDWRAPAYMSIEDYEAQMLEDLENGLPDPNSVRLFYEEIGADLYDTTYFRGSSERYTKPVQIRNGGRTSLEPEDPSMLDESLNYAVLCFMLDQDEDSTLYLGVEDGYILKLNIPLRHVHKVEGRVSFVRTLLRQQVKSTITFKEHRKDSVNPGSALLCYVEWSQTLPKEDSYDCILSQAPLPRKVFSVWHATDESDITPMPARILQTDISAQGLFAATLSSIGDRLFLALWKLDLADEPLSRPYQDPVSTPIAQSEVDTHGEGAFGFSVSMSWDGSQIAVYRVESMFFPGEVVLFNDPRGVNHHQSQEKQTTLPLQPSTHHSQCTRLQSFKGHAKFTIALTETGERNDNSELFVACGWEGFSVFKTSGQWEMLYHIPLTRYQYRSMNYSTQTSTSIASGILSVTMSPYQVCVWDLASGELLSHLDTTQEIRRHFLSSTGETVAIVTKSILFLYSTKTGDLLQRSHSLYESGSEFIEGNRSICCYQSDSLERYYLIADTSSMCSRRKVTLLSYTKDCALHDIKLRNEWDGTDVKSTVFAQQYGSTLEVSYLEDIVTSVDKMPPCSSDCTLDLTEIPEIRENIEVQFSGGEYVIQVDIAAVMSKLTIDIHYKDGKSQQYWWDGSNFFILEKQSLLVMMEVFANRQYSWVWKLPQSSQEDLDLLLVWAQESDEEVPHVRSCAHERVLVLTTGGSDVRLTPERAFAPENAEAFFYGMFGMIGNCFVRCQEVLDAQSRYLRSFFNFYPCPYDKTLSVISMMCGFWEKSIHFRIKPFLKKALQSSAPNNWVPLEVYPKGSNPVWIMLEKAKEEPVAMEIVRMFVEYCFEKAKATKDVIYILHLLDCMDVLTDSHADLAFQITRGFAFVRNHDRQFIMDNYRIAHPPAIRRFWTPNNTKIYECRNPILQIQLTDQASDPDNKNFTEVIFAAPVNLLWSFEKNPRSPCEEFPFPNPKRLTNWPKALYHIALFNLNPFSHVYIRPRFYSLEILDNPAIEAVIQYKWNTFVFGVWMVRFSIQCIYSLLIVIAALMQVYYKEKDSLLGVFVIIILLSCVFLWLEFLQWRESRYYAEPEVSGEGEMVEMEEIKVEESPQNSPKRPIQPLRWIMAVLRSAVGKSPEDSKRNLLNLQRTRSPYFRSPYNLLDLVMYLYPLATSVHQISNIVYGKTEGVTADFSFCVMITFLHLLAELRVTETVCKYITIVFGIIREIRVFFMVFAASMLFFTIAIVHVLHGVGTTNGSLREVNLPDDFLGAISTVYLMMGGRYDPIASDMYADTEGDVKATYKNAPLLVMVMVYFTFSSILMLNVLIALINSAFVKADDSWRQAWHENRLRYVESAENMSYHIPGFRETFDWFPKIIYYTATPYQVKQYRRRIAKKDEELMFDEEQEKQPFESEDDEDDEDGDNSKEAAETPLAAAAIKGLEGELTKQSQTQQEGFTDIKEKFVQHLEGLRTGISQELEKTVEKSQVDMTELKGVADILQKEVSGLQQDIMGLDKRASKANEEISEVKGELSVMKETMSETKREVSEVKEGIVGLQNDLSAILEVLRDLQRQGSGPKSSPEQ